MITEFKIFENEKIKIVREPGEQLTIYDYRGIIFSMMQGGYYLYSYSNDESFEMGLYLDEKDWDKETDKGSYVRDYLLGNDLEEVRKNIDEYYMNKEMKKYNL